MKASSFKDLKKKRGDILKEVAKEAGDMAQGKQNYDDERFWNYTRDKAGNAQAVIRFLPAPPGEETPFVKYFSHGFKGPTGLWYIENSRTSIGEDDPVAEYNSRLWDSGSEKNKEQARAQKRRMHFVSNIYVVSDPANPDNEGKVFLFRYGKVIFDMLNELMNPSFNDQEPINPFDFWEGANMRLRVRKVEGWVKYDKSTFDEPAPLSDDDDELEKIWKSEYSLREFLDPSNYKSYDELAARLKRVLGGEAVAASTVSRRDDEEESSSKSRTFSSKKKADEEELEDAKEVAELKEEESEDELLASIFDDDDVDLDDESPF